MKLDLRGRKVADLGTGSGLLALLAARAGGTVAAIDLSPTAVACAVENARRNGLAASVRVIVSDLFESAPSEDRFDLVITNPPFYSRDPDGPADQAFAAGVANGFFARLAESLPRRLEPGGVLLMIQSSDADFEPIASMFAARGMSGRVVYERRGVFETLTIREFTAQG